MESYLVRIYRRDENDPKVLIGTVQKVGGEGKEVFSTVPDLWGILNPLKEEPANPPRAREKSSARVRQKKVRTQKRRNGGKE